MRGPLLPPLRRRCIFTHRPESSILKRNGTQNHCPGALTARRSVVLRLKIRRWIRLGRFLSQRSLVKTRVSVIRPVKKWVRFCHCVTARRSVVLRLKIRRWISLGRFLSQRSLVKTRVSVIRPGRGVWPVYKIQNNAKRPSARPSRPEIKTAPTSPNLQQITEGGAALGIL
jgi:hypothetical protein